MRALVVDDDELLLEVYAGFIRDLSFEVDVAHTAEQALGQVTAGRYDVVLTDIQMPGMTGVEFLKDIRHLDLDVPVILMTGAPNTL
jgi:two-component system, NtrC family, response regulator AtoC